MHNNDETHMSSVLISLNTLDFIADKVMIDIYPNLANATPTVKKEKNQIGIVVSRALPIKPNMVYNDKQQSCDIRGILLHFETNTSQTWHDKA